MKRRIPSRWRGEAGFSLFEALVAIAVMALILGALASVTAQWLPAWNRGLARSQASEQLAIALDRLTADLAAAEFVTPNQSDSVPLFVGEERSVMFVRSALGPNNRAGMEIVKIAETTDRGGRALVRTRAAFTPLPAGARAVGSITFAGPVVLLREPYRVNFAYANPRGGWLRTWIGSVVLPTSVRIEIRQADRETVLSTATRVHAELAAPRPEAVQDSFPGQAQAQSARGG